MRPALYVQPAQPPVARRRRWLVQEIAAALVVIALLTLVLIVAFRPVHAQAPGHQVVTPSTYGPPPAGFRSMPVAP